MKKFKIRNRIKRKYVKKHETQASFPLSNTLAWGILPTILMAIAFLATLLINHPPADTLPNLTLPNLWDATSSVSNLINNFPTIHLEWNLHINTFNPQSLFGTLSYGVSAVLQTLIHVVIMLIISISNLFASTDHTFRIITTAIGQNILFTAHTLGTFLAHITGFVVGFFTGIYKAITSALHAFFYFIATPFRITGHFLLQFKPVYSFIGGSLQHSYNDLINNFNSLANNGIQSPKPSH